MDDKVNAQKEVLETLVEFNVKLLHNMKIVVKELSGERMDDTDNFVNAIVEAMNWEVEAMNGTIDFLNSGSERINSHHFNNKMISLDGALKSKDDGLTAAAITELIPEFEQLGIAAEAALAS